MRSLKQVFVVAVLLWTSSSLLASAVENRRDLPSRDTSSILLAPLFTHWVLLPQLSVITPTSLLLTRSQYSAPYSNTLSGLPGFFLGIATPLSAKGDILFSGIGRIGISFKSANVQFTNTQTQAQTDTSSSLVWVPLSVGVKAQYSIPDFPYIQPSLTAGTGVQWLHQSCNLPNVSGSFFLPHLFISPALSFFGSHPSEEDWFQGFNFGLTFDTGFLSSQTVRGWSYDLSISILL